MLQCRPGGEIGRRASLRCWWAQALAGSNPVPGIILHFIAMWLSRHTAVHALNAQPGGNGDNSLCQCKSSAGPSGVISDEQFRADKTHIHIFKWGYLLLFLRIGLHPEPGLPLPYGRGSDGNGPWKPAQVLGCAVTDRAEPLEHTPCEDQATSTATGSWSQIGVIFFPTLAIIFFVQFA